LTLHISRSYLTCSVATGMVTMSLMGSKQLQLVVCGGSFRITFMSTCQ